MSTPSRWFDRPWGRRIVLSVLASTIVASLTMIAILWTHDRAGDVPSAERYAFARSDGGELPELWRAPSFSLIDQHGRAITLESLRGQPFVADFIYTQCTSACPMLTSKMVMLQRSLLGQNVRFVSFSVDPAHDTPDALAAYAARWNEHETRWTLLATTDASLADVASGFRVTTEKTREKDDPILHSTFMFLVDRDGLVRGVYPSNEGDMMARLAADARRLAGDARTSEDASSLDLSKDLYTSLGCPGCHANARLAPPLVNLLGADRMLQDGRRVTIDVDYLRRSILDPGADVVAGYAPLMPSYRHPLSKQDVDRLVAELEARTSPDAGAPANSAALVDDPVCHMKVRAVADAPHATYGGKAVYFCSDTCKETFEKHPERYPSEVLAGTKGATR